MGEQSKAKIVSLSEPVFALKKHGKLFIWQLLWVQISPAVVGLTCAKVGLNACGGHEVLRQKCKVKSAQDSLWTVEVEHELGYSCCSWPVSYLGLWIKQQRKL